MADDESSAPRPGPVVLRIKLRYDDADTMIQRFAANAGRSGLFLPTKSIQPVGTEVKFELRLANDEPVLVGLGRVKAARAPDPAQPKQAFGMAVELMRVTRESRALILKMLDRRKQIGLADVALPMPEDVDAARRVEIDSAVREADAVPREASGPAENLLTAPRRTTGPMAVKRDSAFPVAALAPEIARRPRPRVSEVVDRAIEKSGRMVAAMSVVGGLDEYVDVEKAMIRARALATGDLDAELEALRDQAAAPIAISVQEASAELARQLGGAAVGKRDRSWAPPPEVVVAKPAEEIFRETFADLDEPSTDIPVPVAQSIPPPTETSVVEDAAALIESEAALETNPGEIAITPPAGTSLLIDDDVDPAQFDHDSKTVGPDALLRRADIPIAHAFDDVHEAPQDVEHEVSEDDFAESTQIGEIPIAPDAYATVPAVPEEMADRLDAHLDEAEAEADQMMEGETGFASEYETMPADGAVEPVHLTEPSSRHRLASEPAPEPEEVMEIDDFEILAEADADDADLLMADGERDAEPESPVSNEFDYGRFDFGDDSEMHRAAPPAPAEEESVMARPPIMSDDFDEPHAFSQPPPYDHAALAAPTFNPKSGSAPDVDLESALADLDVDFDDFGAAESPIHRVRPRPRAQRAQRAEAAPRRAATDDGVMIDFDEDE